MRDARLLHGEARWASSLLASARLASARAAAALLALSSCAVTQDRATGPRPAGAHEVEAPSWTFEFEPYAWVPSAHGTGATDSTSTSDIDLVGSLASALPLAFAARSADERTLVVADGFYLRLDDEEGALRTSTEVVMVEAGVGVALDRRARWHAIGGLRFVDIDYDVQLLSGSGQADLRWLDPWVGVLGEQPITDAFAARLRADVGGFGVGTRFTWQVIAALRARVASAIAVDLGYRAIGVDYDDGDARFDAVFEGPIAGISISF